MPVHWLIRRYKPAACSVTAFALALRLLAISSAANGRNPRDSEIQFHCPHWVLVQLIELDIIIDLHFVRDWRACLHRCTEFRSIFRIRECGNGYLLIGHRHRPDTPPPNTATSVTRVSRTINAVKNGWAATRWPTPLAKTGRANSTENRLQPSGH